MFIFKYINLIKKIVEKIMEDLKESKLSKKEDKKIKKIYDEDDENELPDIIPAGELPPEGTPIPKLIIENPQKPENKRPPDTEKLINSKV